MPVTGKTTVLKHQPSVNISVLGVLRSRNAELSVTGWETSRPTGGCALPSCRFPYSISTHISSLTWLTRGFLVLILQPSNFSEPFSSQPQHKPSGPLKMYLQPPLKSLIWSPLLDAAFCHAKKLLILVIWSYQN